MKCVLRRVPVCFPSSDPCSGSRKSEVEGLVAERRREDGSWHRDDRDAVRTSGRTDVIELRCEVCPDQDHIGARQLGVERAEGACLSGNIQRPALGRLANPLGNKRARRSRATHHEDLH
jgi:hypothetical protein